MKRTITRQDQPNTLKLELTQGCNLSCSFCGINGIDVKKGQYSFLTVDMAKTIADNLKKTGWNSKIEFGIRGEDTMNPNLLEIVSIFRERLSENQILLTTNGGGLVKNTVSKIKELMKYVNILAIEEYSHANIYNQIYPRIKYEFENVYRYPDDGINPYSRIGIKKHIIIFFRDIKKADYKIRICNNMAAIAAPPDYGYIGKRCPRPFREFPVRFDGKVVLCCNDWRGEYYCGNILTRSAEEVWQNERFMTARRFLYNGLRTFRPCYGCNSRGHRVGLLPDRMGKKTLPLPTEEDVKYIKRAACVDTLTKPRLRKWERQAAWNKLLKNKLFPTRNNQYKKYMAV